MALQESSLTNNGTNAIVSTDPRPTVELTFQALTMCVIMLASLVGNSLIIIAIYIDRTLQTVTNVFVVNLACADLLLALSGMPFTLVSSITYEWIFGTIWCDINGMANSLFCVASMLTLAAVSIDRFIAIVRPLRYMTYMTSKTAAAMIVYIWLHSLLIALLPIMGWSEYTFLKKESICTVYWELDISLTVFIFVVCFFFPFAIMIFTYSRVLNAAWKQSKRIVPITGRFSEKRKPDRNESSTYEPISIGSLESVNQQSQTISTGLPTPLSTDEMVNGCEMQTEKGSILSKETKTRTDKERSDNVNSNGSKMRLCLANKTKYPEHIDRPLRSTQDLTTTMKTGNRSSTTNDVPKVDNYKTPYKLDDCTNQIGVISRENDRYFGSNVDKKAKSIIDGKSIITKSNSKEPPLQDNYFENTTGMSLEDNTLPSRSGRRVIICNDAQLDYDTYSQSSLELSDDCFISPIEENVLKEKVQNVAINPSSLHGQEYEQFTTHAEKINTVKVGKSSIKPANLYDQESDRNKMFINEQENSNQLKCLYDQKTPRTSTAPHEETSNIDEKISIKPSSVYNLAPLRSGTGHCSLDHNIIINNNTDNDNNKNNSKHNTSSINNNNNNNVTSSNNDSSDTSNKQINNLDDHFPTQRPKLVINDVDSSSPLPQNTPRMRRITVAGSYSSTKNNIIHNSGIPHQAGSNSTPYLQKSNSMSSLRVDTRNNSNTQSNTRQRKVSTFQLPNMKALRRKTQNTNGLLKLKQEKKAVRTLLIVVGSFVLCWLPHFIGIFCILTKECTWPDRYFAITTWLAMANSGCNPVIYGAMSRQFRRRFKQILQCKKGFF